MAKKISSKSLVNFEVLEKMLQHFSMYNFTKVTDSNWIKFGIIGENLKQFIKQEWLSANAVSSDHPSFLCDSLKTKEELKTAFSDTKNLVGATPFSLVDINISWEGNLKKEEYEPNNALQVVRNQFKGIRGTMLRNQTFCSPTSAVEDFYKKQRERKIWWRKFSASPGRFTCSNVSNNETNKSATCDILAEFPWGLEAVETITYLPDFCSEEKDFYEVKISKRKKSSPHLVVCETLLEKITFTYLCDAYEKLNNEKSSDVLKFNKKLAPFKVSIAASGNTSDTVQNLEELSLLLAKQIRKLGFSVLLLPDRCTISKERQILRNDALGVLFTILLNDKTLKDGTLTLRSRDTTLKEHSHVSLIAEHLDKLLK